MTFKRTILFILFILIITSCTSKKVSLSAFTKLTGINSIRETEIKRCGSSYSPFPAITPPSSDGSFYLVAELSKDKLTEIESIDLSGYSEIIRGPITNYFLLWIDFGYKNEGYGKGQIIGDDELVDLVSSENIKYRVKLYNADGNNGELIIYDYRFNKLWFTKWDI